MNSKFLKALPVIAIALIATAPLSHATKYSPTQFTAELKKVVGTKTGLTAVNAAATFYRKALLDAANKKQAAAYASSIVSVLKYPKVVSTALAGKAVNTYISSLQKGLFTGSYKYNLNDPTYNKALQTFLSKLPPTAKSSQLNTNTFYSTIKQFATSKKVTQLDVYNFYLALAKKTGVKDPSAS